MGAIPPQAAEMRLSEYVEYDATGLASLVSAGEVTPVAGADTGLFLRPTWAILASSSALSMQSIELACALVGKLRTAHSS